MDRLTCPLIEFGCRRDRCAWWDEEGQACSIVTSTQTLKDIKAWLAQHATPRPPEPQKFSFFIANF